MSNCLTIDVKVLIVCGLDLMTIEFVSSCDVITVL